MKLATFIKESTPELGVVQDSTIVSITRAAPRLASDMLALIGTWAKSKREVQRIASDAAHSFALKDVHLKAPIARPGKIMAIGLNYADHIAETGQPRPEKQIWFSKMTTSINGPYDPIVIARTGQSVDYEAELVAVIGTGGRHITKADAKNAVFGYCCGNDVSERAWQWRTPQWVLGKSFDTHAPIGPWITTADEVGDPHRLAIKCFVNGEQRQESNTKNLIFTVWDQIEELTQVMTLEPGDLIFTGTPGGIGGAMKPPKFLKPSDRVRIEIEELGAIEAACVAET
jgi:ureidoglycolate lyase